jgi:hypothetical protein
MGNYHELRERQYRHDNAAYLARKERSGYGAALILAGLVVGILTLIFG